MAKTPGVSVIIPAYNAELCLTRAIRSIQAQTYQDLEIIVINDASTDGTAALVGKLASEDRRIKLITQAVNCGPSIARNTGFGSARGTWLAILDADDAFHPDRLQRLVSVAAEGDLDMVMDGIELHDAGAPDLPGDKVNWFNAPVQSLSLESYLANDFTGQGFGLSICKPMFRREFIGRHDLSYPASYRHGEDSYFYTLLMIHGARAAVLQEAYYIYTTSIGRVTGRRSPFTRTVEDYVLKARSVTDLIAIYEAQMSPAANELMRLRRDRILDTDAFWKLRKAIRVGKVMDALALVRARPHSAHMLAVAAVEAIRKRIIPNA